MFNECLINLNFTLITFEVATVKEYIVCLGLPCSMSKPKFGSAVCNGRFAAYLFYPNRFTISNVITELNIA